MLHSLTIRKKNITNKKKSFQVLIDDRDQPFIKHRNLPESVTFLRNGDPSEKNRSLYAISGRVGNLGFSGFHSQNTIMVYLAKNLTT